MGSKEHYVSPLMPPLMQGPTAPYLLSLFASAVQCPRMAEACISSTLETEAEGQCGVVVGSAGCGSQLRPRHFLAG